MSYVKPAAKLIAAILREHIENEAPTRVLDRAVLRQRWSERFPNQGRRQRLVTEEHKVRRRRNSYLAGAEHHRGGRSAGVQGTTHLNEALRQLERLGVLLREETTVRVLDVPKLVQIANPPPRDRDAPGPADSGC